MEGSDNTDDDDDDHYPSLLNWDLSSRCRFVPYDSSSTMTCQRARRRDFSRWVFCLSPKPVAVMTTKRPTSSSTSLLFFYFFTTTTTSRQKYRDGGGMPSKREDIFHVSSYVRVYLSYIRVGTRERPKPFPFLFSLSKTDRRFLRWQTKVKRTCLGSFTSV